MQRKILNFMISFGNQILIIMKKWLFSIAIMVMVVTASGAYWQPAIWDEPLKIKKFTPTISYTLVGLQDGQFTESGLDEIILDVYLSEGTDNHTWKAVIPVRAYLPYNCFTCNPIRQHKWGSILYSVEVPPYSYHGKARYIIYADTQFQTADGFNVDADQYYIWQWYPL